MIRDRLFADRFHQLTQSTEVPVSYSSDDDETTRSNLLQREAIFQFAWRVEASI